jgi:LacI family trehalose operon transcriptional repressor
LRLHLQLCVPAHGCGVVAVTGGQQEADNHQQHTQYDAPTVHRRQRVHDAKIVWRMPDLRQAKPLQAILTLMQHLYDGGHRHISYLGVPHSDVTTGQRRHDAYLAFCKKHALPAVASLPGLGMKQGYEQVAAVLTPQTTALVCATDTLALGASKYLQEQRIDGLQLASVGNTPLMKFLHPEIITVDPGYADSGRRAALQLIEQINGRSEPRQIVIPATLS